MYEVWRYSSRGGRRESVHRWRWSARLSAWYLNLGAKAWGARYEVQEPDDA